MDVNNGKMNNDPPSPASDRTLDWTYCCCSVILSKNITNISTTLQGGQFNENYWTQTLTEYNKQKIVFATENKNINTLYKG